jgi:hypothetical protein
MRETGSTKDARPTLLQREGNDIDDGGVVAVGGDV